MANEKGGSTFKYEKTYGSSVLMKLIKHHTVIEFKDEGNAISANVNEQELTRAGNEVLKKLRIKTKSK